MNEQNSQIEQDFYDVLKKKALGYDTTESVEEYALNEGEVVLSKKKVTTKTVPPDVTALKMLLESNKDISSLSDEELEREKIRLLKLLGEMEDVNCKNEKNEEIKKTKKSSCKSKKKGEV